MSNLLPTEKDLLSSDPNGIPNINDVDSTSSSPEYSVVSADYYNTFLNLFSTYLPREQVLIYLYSGFNGLYTAFQTVVSLLSGKQQEPILSQESQSQENASDEVPVLSSDPAPNSELILQEDTPVGKQEDKLATPSDPAPNSELILEENTPEEKQEESTQAEISASSDQALTPEQTPQRGHQLNATRIKQFKKVFGRDPTEQERAELPEEKFLELTQKWKEIQATNTVSIPEKRDTHSKPNANSTDSSSESSSSTPCKSHRKRKPNSKKEESYIPGLSSSSSSSSSSSISSPQPEPQEESNPFSGYIEVDRFGFVSITLPHLKDWVKKQVDDYAAEHPNDPEYNFRGGVERNPHITIGNLKKNLTSKERRQLQDLGPISFKVLTPKRMCMKEKGSGEFDKVRKTALIAPLIVDSKILEKLAWERFGDMNWACSPINTHPHITLAQICCKHAQNKRKCHFDR